MRRPVAGFLASLVLLFVLPASAQERTQETPVYATRRLAGDDRFATASAVARFTFSSATHALLARADQFPDALAGSVLAGRLDAPILLVPVDGPIPAPTLEAFDALGTTSVTLLGGIEAISGDIEARLTTLGLAVDRVAGPSRSATAAAIAARAGGAGIDQGRRTVFLVSGNVFADGLAASPLAYDLGVPILLTAPDRLPDETAEAMDALDVERVLVAGGEAAVSPAVADVLRAQGRDVVRYAGQNRVETAVELAKLATEAHDFVLEHLNFARGDDFPDALAMGPHAGVERAALLLTAGPTTLEGEDAPLSSYLARLACESRGIDLAGGPNAIGPGVVEAIRDALTPTGACPGDPTPQPSPGPSASPQPEPSPDPSPNPSPSPTTSVSPSPGPSASPSPAPSVSPTPSVSPSPTVSATPTVSPTPTDKPEPSPVSAITQSADPPMAPVNSDITVTAEVRRADGSTAAGVTVRFSAERGLGTAAPDPGSGSAQTDQAGLARFTLTSASPGQVEVEGCVDGETSPLCATTTVEFQSAGRPTFGTGAGAAAEEERCDSLDPAKCLFPFPNDHFTVPDPGMDTGRRVNLSILSTPRNVEQKPIDPSEFNRNDGASPGALIVTRVPGLDPVVTGIPPITDMERSLDADSSIVLVNADTGERHPLWAELDANAPDEANTALLIRPATNLAEGARYIVALRRMLDTAGETIPSSPTFASLRDGTPSSSAVTNARRPYYEELFASVGAVGIPRGDLYLAWDFTVASERNLTERMLHIRDDAFKSLGTAAPMFTVESVSNFTLAQNSRIARRVEGSFVIPSYLTVFGTVPPVPIVPGSGSPPGTPGTRFNYVGSANGLPTRLGGVATQTGRFTCNIPRATGLGAPDPAVTITPSRASLYGHGLLGGRGEVNAGNVASMGNEHNFTFCATDWIGMATEDVPNVATILNDMSNFPTLVDRVQQGMLQFLFLGRLMKHPQGLSSHPAFRGGSPAQSVLDTSDVFYDGNSQGGIIGGALMAVAQDITRGVLGVPGMNYSTLLDRSVDFATYEVAFNASYTDPMERELIFSMIQMLWDRSETNGYAHHLTDDPLANTPAHKVLLHVALGDHQVAQVSAEVEARTIGAATRPTPVAPDRTIDVEPLWDIPRIAAYPFDGSVIEIWDSNGTPVPPPENIPPTAGSDPHSFPRGQANARAQKAAFLQTGGTVVDVCAGAPCPGAPPP